MAVVGRWGAVAGFLGVGGFLWLGSRFGDTPRVTGFFAVLAGVTLFMFGQRLHEHDDEWVTDNNGQRIAVGQGHHVFWIQIRWWGLLVGAGGMVSLVTSVG
ncbi:hypothetical protein [Nitriliruptor alkaliphilus]|uniref:hypothetical protein n=1 Tax=Nitriliruptor alkaliphilus TaxID=427918 RepID=UPI000699057B|nr:hypothetical protein [Nitriliruptor alkaliphilus]